MKAQELLASISGMRVLVAGDLCLDRWCYYEPLLSEPSRETGIPRIAITRSELTPGAAGTVASNLKTLGAREVAVLGLAGKDGHGYDLVRSLQRRQIDTDLLLNGYDAPTFTYTKVINAQNGVEDRPRLDFILADDLPDGVEEEVCRRLRMHAAKFDLICVSDQAETERGGLITALVREELSLLASSTGRIVWVDSRRRIEHFRHAVLKVNHEEAAEARARCQDAPLFRIRESCRAPVLFVTHGGNGVQVVTPQGETWVLTQRVADPVDICGAGDSFTVGAACALAAGADAEAAARLGHLVASVTIMKKGTGVAFPEEVLQAEKALQF